MNVDEIVAELGLEDTCMADITLRSDEHRICICALPVGHLGPHDDEEGTLWSDSATKFSQRSEDQ